MNIKKNFLLIMFVMLILTSCGKSDATSTKNVAKNTSKTVTDVLNEADANHGGNVQNPNDENTKNIKKKKVVANVPDVSNINGGSNLKKSSGKSSGGSLNASDIDIDLTKLSSTMVYSEVYNMMNSPEDYVGKMVRMNGNLAVYKYPERNYYTCIIKDATACCQQGMEFEWKGNHKYPDDYPKEGAGIIVTGVFDIYYEGNNKYCQLKNASLVKDRA